MLSNCGVGEDSWESLGLQGDQLVHPKGNQSWIFTGRTDAEAETPVLWPPYVKSWLIGKDPDAGRDWGQEEKGTTEDEMAGWHHWLDICESEWTLGVSDRQGSLAGCSPWDRKESDTAEQLNWTESSSRHLWPCNSNANKLIRTRNPNIYLGRHSPMGLLHSCMSCWIC